jgi:hypothetical protein
MDRMVADPFSNRMEPECNMLDTGMIDRVLCQFDTTLVVTANESSSFGRETNFAKNQMKTQVNVFYCLWRGSSLSLDFVTRRLGSRFN